MRLKDWHEDVYAARYGAWKAARLPDPRERMKALRLAFEALGVASNRYACPCQAKRALVREAVEAYRASRAALVLERVGTK